MILFCIKESSRRGSIKQRGPFDAEKDAEVLRIAMKGLGMKIPS